MKIAILTLGSRGDVQPYVALGKKAIEKGHQAIICTGKSFKAFIEENGIAFAEAASDLMAMLESKEGQMVFNSALRHPLQTKKYLDTVVNPAYRKSLEQFLEASKGADVIVYHPKAFGAPDIAKYLGIPCISMPPVPITYPIEEFPNLALIANKNMGKVINRWTYKIMGKAERASIKEVNDFREKILGWPKRKAGAYAFKVEDRDIPTIYPISGYLFKEVKSWEHKVYLPGFFYLENEKDSLDASLMDFIKGGPPPIVVSFSSMPLKSADDFKEKLQASLAETKNRAVVLVGNSGLAFKEEPNIMVVKAAPHLLLFPLAKGILHHGGVGTMAAALRSGRPQMIIPFSVDQPFWAHRLYHLGYSQKPLKESKLTVEELITQFKALESDEINRKAQGIKEALESEKGTENALKYIEVYCQSFQSH